MLIKKSGQSKTTGPGFYYGYVVVISLVISIIAMWGPYYAFGVFFLPMLEEFGWTRAVTAGAFSLAMLLQGLFAILMGALNDKFGPRFVIVLSGCLLGSGYILMSQVNTTWHFYLFYGVLIGAGMGGAFIPHMSTVARWFVKRRSLMTGVVAAGTGIGIICVPPLATRLISTYDWRMSYLIIGCTAWLTILLTALMLRSNPDRTDQQKSAIFRKELTGEVIKSFSLQEALLTPQFWLVLGLCFCYGVCLFTTTVHIIPYANDLGISVTGAANIMIIIGISGILGKIVLGGAGDRIGNKKSLIISFTLWVIAYLWLTAANTNWMLYLFSAAFGIAFGGNSASHSPLVARLFGLSSHGLIYGVLALGVTIGGALGPFMAGYIFDTTSNYQTAFMLCAFTGIGGAILTALLKPIKR